MKQDPSLKNFRKLVNKNAIKPKKGDPLGICKTSLTPSPEIFEKHPIPPPHEFSTCVHLCQLSKLIIFIIVTRYDRPQ